MERAKAKAKGLAVRKKQNKAGKIQQRLQGEGPGYFIIIGENTGKDYAQFGSYGIGYYGEDHFFSGLVAQGLAYIEANGMLHVFFVPSYNKKTIKMVMSAGNGIYKKGKKISESGYETILKELEGNSVFHVTPDNKERIMNQILPRDN